MEQISDIVVRNTTKNLRLMSHNDIHEQRLKIDSFIASPFRRSMDSVLDRAQATAQSHVELAILKAELREAEDELVKALAAKTSKEARQMGIRDSISATQSRVEVLRRTLQLQKSKKEDCARIISQQMQALSASKDNADKVTEEKADIHKAISWYNQALGFHVEAGHGVKFTFTNIDAERLTREFSFTVHYGSDIYTLLDCDLQLDDINEMVQELNKTNDLFRFVRLMRNKFVKSSLSESESAAHSKHVQHETSVISASAPALSSSIETNLSTPENKRCKVQVKQRKRRVSESPLLSPVSTSATRRSSRLKGKK